MPSTNYAVSAGTGRTLIGGSNFSTLVGSASSNSASVGRIDAGVRRINSGSFEITRGHIPFVTSGIGAGATIISATLRLYCEGKNGEIGTVAVYIVRSTQASVSTVGTGDYGSVGDSLDSKTLANVTVGAYNDFTIDPTYVSKTGNTLFATREYNDYNNQTPGNDGQNFFNFTQAGGTNPPILVIVTADAPTVTTSAATNIVSNQCTGTGNVTSDGGSTVTERGFVWGVSTNPTTSNSKVVVSGTTGSYTGTLTGLMSGTLYHYRAYATNSIGTSYGADTTLTTPNSGFLALM